MTNEQVKEWVVRYLFNEIEDTEKGIVKLIFLVGDIGVQIIVSITMWKRQDPGVMRFVKRQVVLSCRKVIHDEQRRHHDKQSR